MSHEPVQLAAPAPKAGGRGRTQGRITDAAARGVIEQYAQKMLTAAYEADLWDVSDTDDGNPYDAEARKSDRILYLEAKGPRALARPSSSPPARCEFAQGHPGECVMGIVSGILLDAAGAVVTGSGQLRVLPWEPEDNQLEPVTLGWRSDPEGDL